jgi:hypothetical protein
VVGRNIDHALPVFERTVIALIAWTAGKPPLDDDIFPAERPVSIAAGRPEDCHYRRAGGCGEVHRSGVASDEQLCRFTKRYKFLE